MWYSSLAYQMSPYGKLPVPHLASEKSSVSDLGKLSAEFAFETFATLALAFEFRFAFRKFVFRRFSLPFEFDPMLASARIMTRAPTATIPTTTIPPRTHQTAFDFLCGGIAGIGDHCLGWAVGSS